MCCAIFVTKRISDICRNREANIIQFAYIVPVASLRKTINNRPQHAYTAIAGGTSAKSYDDVFTAFSYGIHYQLTCAITCGHHRITLLWRKQRQSAGLGDFYHRCIALHEILRHDGSHQRVFHVDLYDLAPYRRLKRL